MSDEAITYNWAERHKRKERPTPVLQPIRLGTGSDAYGQAALSRELDELQAEGSKPEGIRRRNDALNKAAFNLFQLVASGHLPELEVYDQLRSTAIATGLTPSETDATLKSARRAGVQQPRVVPELASQVTEVPTLHIAQAVASEATDGHQEGQDRTSWWPEPIDDRAERAAEQPAPTHLVRDDGKALLYSGKVNGLIGESESGKSWVALLAVVQAATGGQRVLILDFEDSPGSVRGRLQTLGATEAQRQLIDYANPDESLTLAASEDLQEALGNRYAVIVADGMNAAMALLGYDLNSNTDATLFNRKILHPLAQTGACVITIDHVPKNPDGRGKGGIGAQAKRSMQDGTALRVEIVEPFGKGQSGTLKLTVDKDRNGAVRGISAGGHYAGKAHLDSIADQVRIHIEAPDNRAPEDRPTWRPTGIMEKVSRFLEQLEGPPSYRQIEDHVGGKKEVVKKAVEALVDDGYVKRMTGSNRSIRHYLERVFRESDAPKSECPPGVPQVSPGDTTACVPRTPSPFGDGGHTATAQGSPVSPAQNGGHPAVEKQTAIDMPDDHASCNHCGDATPDKILDEHRGYCANCAKDMGR